MMHTEKFDMSTNEKRLLHMIKGSKDPKAAADVAIDVIRAFLGPTTAEDRAFLEAIQNPEKRRAVIELLKGAKR